MTNTAPVNRILRSSIVDGPGNRAVLFVQGCNFDCVYCHNPETIALCTGCGACVSACPVGALQAAGSATIRWVRERCVRCDACLRACPHNASPRVRLMSPADVFAELAPSLDFVRGLTVSGGECTRYPAFLRELGRLCHERPQGRALTFFLDSNGSYDYACDAALLAVTDSVMLDIKADPDNDAEYQRVTGGNLAGTSGAGLLDKAAFLARAGKLWEVRTVVSPGLFDAPALVDKVCRCLAAANVGAANIGAAPVPQYKLIRYRPVGVRPAAAAALAEPDAALMDTLAAICAQYGVPSVVV
jgi:pyruvate formate lyase activating enzyme